MRHLRTERHRLTTLQRQLLKWLRMEGGGVLPADRLFTTMVAHHITPDSDAALLSQRFCEAIDNMQRMGYTELRLESGKNEKRALTIYDFGGFSEKLTKEGSLFCWKSGECPVIALTDTGTRYVERM